MVKVVTTLWLNVMVAVGGDVWKLNAEAVTTGPPTVSLSRTTSVVDRVRRAS